MWFKYARVCVWHAEAAPYATSQQHGGGYYPSLVKEGLKILLALIVVLLDTDPGLGIGSPLVAVGVRDVQDTSAGDGGRSSELQVSDFKD